MTTLTANAERLAQRLTEEADERGNLTAGQGTLKAIAKGVGLTSLSEALSALAELRSRGVLVKVHTGTGNGDPTRWSVKR